MQASCIHRHAPFVQRIHARREKRGIVVSPRPTYKAQHYRHVISPGLLPSLSRYLIGLTEDDWNNFIRSRDPAAPLNGN